MRRQRGQSAVEFALMAPIIFLMIFGMIWGGIMFMEYMHYTQIVRTAAREIALESQVKRESENFLDDHREHLKKMYGGPDMYEPEIIFNPDSEDNEQPMGKERVVIKVKFVRKVTLPKILESFDFPPKEINALKYTMKLE